MLAPAMGDRCPLRSTPPPCWTSLLSCEGVQGHCVLVTHQTWTGVRGAESTAGSVCGYVCPCPPPPPSLPLAAVSTSACGTCLAHARGQWCSDTRVPGLMMCVCRGWHMGATARVPRGCLGTKPPAGRMTWGDTEGTPPRRDSGDILKRRQPLGCYFWQKA